MAGGGKWKKPESIKGERVRASVERGPKKGAGPGGVQWYWRIRERGTVGKQLWSGWATVANARIRLNGLEGNAIISAPSPKKSNNNPASKASKQESRMLKVAIVSNVDHAKSVTRKLKELGHMGFNFPEVSGPIPSSMDVIICRIKSTSHLAYNICNEEKRRGVRPVIFENGVSKAVQAIKDIASGSWVEPSLAPDPDVEATPGEEGTEQSDRQRRRTACRDAIVEIIDKGGLFSPILCHRSPSQARDALESVPWDRKHRVKRGAVYVAFNDLHSLKEGTIEAQYEALQADGKYHADQVWWAEEAAIGSLSLLTRTPLTDRQRRAFTEGMTRPGRTYLTEKPEELTGVESLPEAEPVELPEEIEEPEVMDDGIQVSHEPPEEVEAEPEVVVAPPVEVATDESEADEGDSGNPEQAEKDLRDLLLLLREQMEKMELKSLDEAALHEAGLRGSVHLALVHLSSPVGVGCGSEAALLQSRVLDRVTCPECQASEAWAFAEFYAAQGDDA
jgi:hypothetical protein